jgi:hypothetical protein
MDEKVNDGKKTLWDDLEPQENAPDSVKERVESSLEILRLIANVVDLYFPKFINTVVNSGDKNTTENNNTKDPIV